MKNEDEEKEDIISEWQGEVKQFLSDTLVSLLPILNPVGTVADFGDDRVVRSLPRSPTMMEITSRRSRLRRVMSLFLCI